jgi:hypothetical protein
MEVRTMLKLKLPSSLAQLMRRTASALALGGAIAFAAPAGATTVLKVDVADMTRLSEFVVRARVLAVDNVHVKGPDEGIFTDVTVAVDEVYRGVNAPSVLKLRLMGGLGDNGIAMRVPGMPSFKVGEEAVLFLEKSANGYVPSGLEQGVWRIYRGPLGHQVVQQTVLGAQLMVRDAKGSLVPAAGHGQASKLLGQLAAEIRQVPTLP